MQHTILCIDDEPDICDALERLFRKKFRVIKGTSAKQGLEVLKKEKVSVIISDQRMPNMTGVEFFRESLKTHPLAVRILLTGYADIESVIDAINAGQIYRYVTKPWDPLDLTTAVNQAVERYELTAELKEKNESLSVALQELQTLDSAKNQFMILVNHELKTPLTSLINYVDILNETVLDDDQKKYVSRIRQSTDRLHQLINEVLELVGAETNQTPVKIKKVSTSKVFDRVEEEMKKHLGEKQSLKVDNSKGAFRGDEEKIYKILCRLCDNAIRFGKKDDKIHVFAREVSEDVDGGKAVDLVEIGVENSGPALDEKAIRHILKPFALNEDIMKHSSGLGLGLSICQAQLKQHKSTLNFDSAKGKITVSFKLPAD